MLHIAFLFHDHPQCTSHSTSSDFWLFPAMKYFLCGRTFWN